MTDRPPRTARSLDELRRSIQARVESASVQLPLWPEPKRGTPNSFIRSALFSAIQSKDRSFMKAAELFSQQGITIRFTGEQLNQEDLTLWETLVHLAKDQPLGRACAFTAHALLRALGLPTGGEQHRQLHEGITRLNACSVQITHDGKTYFGPLIKSGLKDEQTAHYAIELNRELIKLYGETQWTAIDWQQRMSLRRKPLAQALHAYYSSHRQPFPVKLATLQSLTGSRNSQAASFKRQCRAALAVLVEIGFLLDFTIQGDLVSVRRHVALPRKP